LQLDDSDVKELYRNIMKGNVPGAFVSLHNQDIKCPFGSENANRISWFTTTSAMTKYLIDAYFYENACLPSFVIIRLIFLILPKDT
jgi:hypothetical protein